MKYTLRTEILDEHGILSATQITMAISRLTTASDSFLVVEPEVPVDNVNYLQAAYIENNEKKRGLFKKKTTSGFYYLELQKSHENGDLYQYVRETRSMDEVIQIFTAFFENQNCPDLSHWQARLFMQHS